MAYVIDDIINMIGSLVSSGQQQDAIKKAMGVMDEQWNPYLAAGKTSLADLMNLQHNPDAIQDSAAYKFRMQQGNQALERSASARGGLLSGRTLKGLDRFSQGLASQEYDNQWNRLFQMSGRGQDAANIYSSNIANLYGAKGNAQAAGTVGATNAAGGAVRSVGDFFTMKGLLGGIGGGGGGGGGSEYEGYSQAPQSLIPGQGR